MNEGRDVELALKGDSQETDIEQEEILDSTDNQLQEELMQQSANVAVMNALRSYAGNPDYESALNALMSQSGITRLDEAISPQSIAALDQIIEDQGLRDLSQLAGETNEVKQWETDINNLMNRLKSIGDRAVRDNSARAAWPVAFNLKQHKVAQMAEQAPVAPPPMGGAAMESPMASPSPPMQEENISRFPVTSAADFVEKFVDDLLLFNSEEIGTENYQRAVAAFEEIRDATSGGFQEEANSALETVIQLSPEQRDEAVEILMKVYEVFLPDNVKTEQPQQEEIIMSEKKPESIIRFNLDEHILSNKTSKKSECMTKTAADQFGQQYLLYGPTEKRICPKLRGKNLGVGDVVSEYTCRHHCIDGIVIDDNKTICGEALWRANGMDKQSREYVDADGKITGGYLNKRFEINRLNIDDENRMRLKPGETRKPRPASACGNYEARMQDMRNKEGQKRDYRPDVNTGQPFEWCHDSDQNNVQVNQSERDRREEAMGHKAVQYTSKDNLENKPSTKIANKFNLKNHKTAQLDFTGNPLPNRTFDQMGKDFSPEGSYNHCALCKKRVLSNQLVSEDNGMGGLISVCPDCANKKSNSNRSTKQAELPHPMQVKRPRFTDRDTDKQKMPTDQHIPAVSPAMAPTTPKPADIDPKNQTADYGKPMKRRKSFNLRAHKIAKEHGDFSYKGETYDVNPFAVCFVPGTYITIPDGTSVPIETIKPGQEVVSHMGKVRKVLKTMSQELENKELLRLKVNGVADDIIVTQKHPFLTMKSTRKFKGYAKDRFGVKTGKKWYSDQYNSIPEFIEAGNLKKGDAIHSPSIQFDNKDISFNIDEQDAFILGLYCAKGLLGKYPQKKVYICGNRYNCKREFTPSDKSYQVNFTLNLEKDKFAINFLKQYAQKRFGVKSISVFGPYPLNPKVVTVTIRNKDFYMRCLNDVGKYAKSKRLSPRFMSSANHVIMPFLVGYFLGDGCFDISSFQKKNGKFSSFLTSGRMKIVATSTSRDLINQLFWLSERCGIVTTIRKCKQNGGPSNRKRTYCRYCIELNAAESIKLLPIINTMSVFGETLVLNAKQKSGQRFARAACTFGKVRSVKKVEYTGTVYNLEVEEDNSYLANLCSVHNCNDSTGGKNKAGKEKWESCVQQVKDKSKKSKKSTEKCCDSNNSQKKN